jgi:hypothetical protein|tara:strand:- start:179 stop:415 length:237 start_codon:yes stop_codon:yes gene_type:complete
MTVKRRHYSDEKEQEFLTRAIAYMEKNPKTTRGKVALYAGVGVSVLERFEKEGRLTLPPKMTIKQARATSPWAKGHMV